MHNSRYEEEEEVEEKKIDSLYNYIKNLILWFRVKNIFR